LAPDGRVVAAGYLAFAWLLGIAAAAFSGGNAWATVAAASLLAACTVAFSIQRQVLLLALVAVPIVFVAGWRFEATEPPNLPSGIAQYNERGPVRLRTIVREEPDERSAATQYRLSVRELLVEGGSWLPIEGNVLLTAAPFPRYDYGDLLEIEGELQDPPELPEFDYRSYLQRQGIGSLLYYPEVRRLAGDQGSALRSALTDFRARLDDALSDVLPEPEAALASGVLLGKRSALPPDLRQDMDSTGTSHLTAVSGQNISLLAALLMTALAWVIGRRPAGVLALAAVASYAILVGAQPSVLRAAIMGSLVILANLSGRQRASGQSLMLAGAAMTAFDPQIAKDVSFQLSFAATLGLMTLAPALKDHAEARIGSRATLFEFRLQRTIVEFGAITISAIAFTLPISALNFERVSLIAPLANLLAAPAFLFVAITAALAAAGGAIIPGLAPYFVWLAWPPAAYMIGVVRFCANLPFASVSLEGVGTIHAIAYFAVLGAAVWLLMRARPDTVQRPRPLPSGGAPRFLPAAGVAVVLALGSVVSMLLVTSPTQAKLSVTFLDVGQGDAVLVRTAEGHSLLIDGGPSGEALITALGRHLPFDGRKLNLVALSHPQADHLTGLLTVLERYEVDDILASPLSSDSAVFAAWQDAVRDEQARYNEGTEGQRILLGGGAIIEIMHPPPGLVPGREDDPNENALVLRLTLGQVSILLTSDIGEEAELALDDSGASLRATVLQVPHHGSRHGSTSAFLREVSPQVAVISVGAENPFGHPSPETLERVQGVPIFRTDHHGDITISTNGRRVWIKTQREGR